MTGEAKLSPERARNLAEALAAYNLLMDEIVPESQYYRGKRENPERVAYLGNIIERAAARRREAERTTP
ncbi:hypothetical protein [Actinomadura decatromicini]|uniref:Uncharacterized protein n=1 Tax=Actinomadura decatromicini TaxID=2604572 RepID=A0A5D3FS44_9ACTN|nr:hypothetical protein [Actinomadura decatromicini]TYK50878.1 hypothetical protein FXF68_10460 [Actinomadura decatromicini]